jgi:hypothetical protein
VGGFWSSVRGQEGKALGRQFGKGVGFSLQGDMLEDQVMDTVFPKSSIGAG